jgi:hypothetical protein
MTKVQLTLTNQEAAILSGYGTQLGYNLPKVAKFFISKASEQILKEGVIPEYKMSKATEEAGLKALEEYRQGKAHKVDDIDEFFDSL